MISAQMISTNILTVLKMGICVKVIVKPTTSTNIRTVISNDEISENL